MPDAFRMYRLRTYPDLVSAEMAAAFLRREGVLARAFDTAMDIAGPFSGALIAGSAQVTIAVERDRAHAKALLDVFDRQPVELDDDWETSTEPDLSRLDPSLRLCCPACRMELPSVRAYGGSFVVECVSCRELHDLAQVVLDQHGPEALAACYPEDDELMLPGDAIERAAMDCSVCRYPLDGLPTPGHCPECGTRFDKHAIARALLEGRDPN